MRTRDEILTFFFKQIAGLISAIIVLIVTVGIGFLLEPLPRVSEKEYFKRTKEILKRHCSHFHTVIFFPLTNLLEDSD